MMNNLRITVVSAACVAAGLAYTSAYAQSPLSTTAQSNLRERLAAAVETVEGACAADLKKFCGNVTRGEGRLVQCMQAFDDQLSKRCQFALYRYRLELGGSLPMWMARGRASHDVPALFDAIRGQVRWYR